MKIDVKIGKCPRCKKKKVKLYHGICDTCHREIFESAEREGRNHNPFIG